MPKSTKDGSIKRYIGYSIHTIKTYIYNYIYIFIYKQMMMHYHVNLYLIISIISLRLSTSRPHGWQKQILWIRLIRPDAVGAPPTAHLPAQGFSFGDRHGHQGLEPTKQIDLKMTFMSCHVMAFHAIAWHFMACQPFSEEALHPRGVVKRELIQ